MKAANRTMTNRRPARILIVDDHPLVCRGLEELMALQADLDVCGKAGGMAEAHHELRCDRRFADTASHAVGAKVFSAHCPLSGLC